MILTRFHSSHGNPHQRVCVCKKLKERKTSTFFVVVVVLFVVFSFFSPLDDEWFKTQALIIFVQFPMTFFFFFCCGVGHRFRCCETFCWTYRAIRHRVGCYQTFCWTSRAAWCLCAHYVSSRPCLWLWHPKKPVQQRDGRQSGWKAYRAAARLVDIAVEAACDVW